MKKSKFTILLLFLVMILAISAASAADLDDTSDSVVQAVDEAAVDEVASADVDDVVSTDNTANVLTTGGKNFTSLKDDIAGVQDTKTLELQSNYTRVGNEAAIEINKDVTIIIEGNGFTIDGNNNGGIFDVKQGGVLILQNVFLINGNTQQGGAIYNNGNVIIMSDTQFSGNNASLGGAIYNTNTGNVKITGSTLDGNTATYGGAVYNLGKLEVDQHSEFNENTATYKGGAIYSEGTVNVKETTFDGNDITYRSGPTSNYYGGAAIYNLDGTLTVDGSHFYNNIKNYVGRGTTGGGDMIDGAITTSGNVIINNSDFERNSGTYGSAITMAPLSGNQDGSITIDTCTFNENIGFAGTVQIYGGSPSGNFEVNILNSYFKNSLADGVGSSSATTSSGGALVIMNNNKKVKVSGTTFDGNKVSDPSNTPNGGAVHIEKCDVDFDDCTFENNHADNAGGAINVLGGSSLSITNSKFNNNSVSASGGAVYFNGNDLVIDNVTFEDNKAKTAGALYVYSDSTTTISNSEFISNNATGNGGAIFIYSPNGALNANIANTNFTDNFANNTGGAILASTGNVNIDDATFTGNTATNDGGAIYARKDATTSVEDSKFTGNTATNGEGNAIYNVGALTLSGNEISKTSADVYSKGGSIPSVNVTVTINGTDSYIYTIAQNVTLNATITDVDGNLVNGDFIFVLTNIDGSENTTATYNGGNQYSASFNPVKDLNYVVSVAYANGVSTFNNMTTAKLVTVRGTFRDLYEKVNAAMASPDKKLDLEYSFAYTPEVDDVSGIDFSNGITIDNALAINGNGHTISGSNTHQIFKVTSGATLIINNTTFTKSRGDYGSAINVGSGSTLNANYVTFDDNVADHGALFAEGAKINLNHVKFVNNDIINRKGDQVPGFYSEFCTVLINNSVFENNLKIKANRTNNDTMCGALAAYGTNFEIYNSNFTDNSADKGGALTIAAGTSIIDNCRFINNTAYNGGAIEIYYGAKVDINNSYFEDNIAAEYGSPGYTSAGGAIAVTNNGNALVNIEGSTFKHNVALVGDKPHGGAVSIQNSVTNIESCVFEDNEAGKGGAVYLNSTKPVSVTKSNFTNNKANIGTAILNEKGTLTIAENKVFSDKAEIISNGEVKSPNAMKVIVMDNDTYSFNFKNITLYANITDDAGNLFIDPNFKFVVGTQAPINATYNPNTKLYEATYTPVAVGEFVVTVTDDVAGVTLDIKTAKITFAKSLIDIQNKIDAANAGDTIELDDDYAYIPKFDSSIVNGIVINKNITIDGKGKTISGSDLARLFNVTAPYTLTLTNVTLTKGKADEGAAVLVNAGATLKADYVTFSENTAEWGGAVYNYGNTSIDHSVFDSNDNSPLVGTGASAICNEGKLLINNTLFENNLKIKANRTAGHDIFAAIFSNADLEVYNSNFTNNSAVYGGAFAIGGGYSKIDNCRFINNTAYAGGAIQISAEANVDINNSYFEDNVACEYGNTGYTSAGGAIAILNNGNAVVNIERSTFKHNVAIVGDKPHGGAITIQKSIINIESCVFEENEAPKGGAIFNNGGTASVTKSNFTNNQATNGSAIYSTGTLALSGNKVVSTDAEIESKGTITSTIKVVILNGEVKTINTLEANLTAKVTDDTGINLIKDAQFKFTINGEEVPAEYDNGLYKATYTLPTAGIYPVNITYVTDDKNLEVVNGTVKSIKGTFTDLKEKLAVAGDVVLPYNFTYTPIIDGDNFPTILINKVIDGNGFTIDANGASINIFTVDIGNTATLKNMVITGVNMSSTVKYGAVINKGSLTVDNVTFIDNKINRVNGNDAGVAIWNNGNSLTVIGSKFINNTSPYNFEATSGQTIRSSVGAIHSIASSGVSIRDSYFERNIGRWGAAITFENFNQASAAVENCTFYNNTAYQGGAININWGCGVVNVTNCTFDSNSYIGPNGDNTHGANGGAISSGYGTLLLSDSIFKNNKGDDSYISSGAAVSFSDGAGGQIINCTFENNVDLNAAAIDVGDVNGAAASVTIKDSRFINNIANGKSPVHINAGVTAEVENCTFEGTQSTYDIYNEGTLTLTKNTLPKGVYSNGTVKSPVINATLIGGKNITAALYDEVYPSATLTDDKGNAIYDPNFNITVDGVALKTDYDKETGLYNATYFIESAGDKLVNTTYTTVGLVITTGTYKVDKANVTEFTVVVGGETARILFGENATVEITLLGVNGEKLNVTDMVVVVNNTPYLVNITNGTGSFNVSGLLPGDYAALANFAGDGNYNAKYDTGVFTVLSPDLGIKVSIEDITYLDYPLINVTVGDDTFSGFITVTIDDKEYTVPVILGEGSLLALDVFDAGLHTYNATFAGDKTYAPNQTSNKEFKVSPRKVYVDVDTDSGVDYQGIGRICVLLEDENGDPVLDIIELILKDSNGAEVGRMYVETTERFHDRGEVWNDMLFTTKLPIGNYTVTFDSPNFVFEKMEEIYEFTSYGDEGKTIPYGTGTARVNDRQSWIEVEVLTNSIEGFEGNIYYINGNDVGTKTIYQLYEYDEDTDAMNPTGIFVEVTKMNVPVEFEYSVHKVYIEDVKVTEGEGEYVYNTEHNVTIELNGPEKYTFISYGDEGKTIKYGAGLVEITDEDGDWIQVKVLLNDFDDSFIGKYYYVNASETKDVYELYEYDYDADTMNATGIFVEISKVEINCNAVIEIGIADEDGKFNYSDSIDAKVEDGKLTVDLSSLKPGDYRLRLSLVDDTYEVVSWDDEYIVPYKELSSEDDYCLFRVQEVNVYLENVNGTQWTNYGENRTFNFELWCSYWLNGKEIEEAFIYTTTANVTVYKVERDDNGNIVSLTKVYSNETVAITDGTIEGIDLSNLNASEYKVTVALIDPYYQLSGWDEGQDVDYFVEYFNVDRTGVEVNVTVDQPITYGENATVTITIITPTGEKLNETVDVCGLPDIDKVTLVNGTITFDASGLNAGEHTIWVNFNGTDNFWDSYNNIHVFNVDKATPTFEINDTSAEWNIPVDIPIKLIGANGEPITGTVIVSVDGIEKVVRLDENGTGVATFTITTLGDLTITATFDGNDNYYGATGTATLTVNDSTEAKMDVSAPSEIVYNETLNISVNLTNGRGAAIAGATVNYTVDGGEVQTATTADDGTVIIPIKDLARGEHTIVVLFDNASYVNQPSETITVDVKAAPSSVVIDDIASATYPDDVTITYAVINETDVTIVVKDADGNEITSGVDTSVDGTVTISGLNAGEYSITITNADKGNYSGSSDSKTFKVLKNASITTIEFTITGDKLVDSPLNITFTLPTDINPNNVTAFIDGHPYTDLTVNETTGVYTAVFDGFAVATGYTFRVEVDDPNYELISDKISFVIDKVTPEIIISDIAGNAGDTVTATVTIAGGDATGYVLLDGVSYKVENGQATISVPITMAGMQNITVVYTGDDKYYNATKSKEFNAGKGVPTIKVEAIAAKDVYPGAVTVIVTSDVDGTYNITVDGVTKPVTVANGVGQESFSNVSAGTQNATVTFIGDVNYNVTTVEKEFTINKANATGVCEVKVTRYPDDVVITIEGTDGVYNASVDAEHFVEITVVGGNGTGNISGLAAGAYNLTVNYIENNNYNPIEFKFEFVVDKDYSYVELTPVSETVTYPGAVNITFTYKNGEPKFNVTDASGKEVSFTIDGDKIVLTGLAAGTYTVEALIKATENYTADYDVITFDVEKAAVVIEPKATGEFIVDGKVNVTFKLPTDVTGNVYAYIDGEPTLELPTPVEGVYTFEFNAFQAGSHTFVVSLTNDSNYTDAMGQTSFDVEKINVTISIVPDNSVPNPENILIKVADNATGSIFVEIPGYLTLQQYELDNGAYILQLGPIPADDYEIFVTYMGDAKYNNGSANATFTIVKLVAPEVIVNITDTEIVGQKDVVVNITVGDNFAYPGNVTVYVDNIPVQTVAIDEYGNVTVTIPALENGTHTIGVKYNGNAYFNASDVNTTIVTVTKAPSTVTIEPVGNVTYGSEVVIKYEITNRTDKVNITVVDEAGKDYKDVVIIEDSVITIKDVIPAGTYTVTIINGENGFYTESQANITFNVTKGPEIDINVVENTTTPTFTITLPEDAKGNLLVDIDGNHYYAPVVNGTASVTVPALVAGEYTANITYTGDGKYPEISKTTNVSVPSNLPENAISIPTSTSNLNPTFGVNLPSDAGGYIEVDVDGKKYYAGVENGKASVSLPGLATGQHKVTVTYSGDGKYTKISKSATVTLTDPVPGLSGNKNVNVIYSASATYKVRVTLDGKAAAGQTVVIKFNGKTYNVQSDANGYATLKLNTKVKPKTYTITATYKGITVKNKVKVKHILKVKNKVVKKSKKVTKVKITFKKISKTTSKKSKAKTKVIKIKFRGKTYKVKTKSRVATWKVKKSMVKKLKVGKKYKYRVTYGKDVVTKKLTIKK